jgi:hypothetical protein
MFIFSLFLKKVFIFYFIFCNIFENGNGVLGFRQPDQTSLSIFSGDSRSSAHGNSVSGTGRGDLPVPGTSTSASALPILPILSENKTKMTFFDAVKMREKLSFNLPKIPAGVC